MIYLWLGYVYGSRDARRIWLSRLKCSISISKSSLSVFVRNLQYFSRLRNFSKQNYKQNDLNFCPYSKKHVFKIYYLTYSRNSSFIALVNVHLYMQQDLDTISIFSLFSFSRFRHNEYFRYLTLAYINCIALRVTYITLGSTFFSQLFLVSLTF